MKCTEGKAVLAFCRGAPMKSLMVAKKHGVQSAKSQPKLQRLLERAESAEHEVEQPELLFEAPTHDRSNRSLASVSSVLLQNLRLSAFTGNCKLRWMQRGNLHDRWHQTWL